LQEVWNKWNTIIIDITHTCIITNVNVKPSTSFPHNSPQQGGFLAPHIPTTTQLFMSTMLHETANDLMAICGVAENVILK
jgi:hypothetical protein